MRLSIAMATFNGGRYLRPQLESLARQTRLPTELRIADDGSSDDTAAIVEGFARGAPFAVHYTRNERRLGYRENFLACAAACTGDYIAFCDQDDTWEPKKLETLEGAIALGRKSGAAPSLVIHSGLVTDSEGRATGARYPRVPRSVWRQAGALDYMSSVPGFALCFDARLIRDIPWQDRPCDPNWPRLSESADEAPLMAHDQWIFLLGTVLGRCRYVAADLVRYRRHASTATTAKGEGKAGFSGMLRLALHTGWHRYAHMAACYRQYAQCFRNLADGSEAFREQLLSAAARFDDLASCLGDRAALYEPGTTLRARAIILQRMLRAGAYRDDVLGKRALAKDVGAASFATYRPSPKAV